MRKFFFDDVRAAPDGTWIVARDVAHAKEILSREDFDVWSLDHDIQFEMMCDLCSEQSRKDFREGNDHALEDILMKGCEHIETGTHLVQWIVENRRKFQWPRLIILHSGNHYGRNRMESILAPFREFTEIKQIPFNRDILRSIEWQDEAK